MCKTLASLMIATAAFGALTGCGRHEAAQNLADELDKALDPAPQYVDDPAREPREPQ